MPSAYAGKIPSEDAILACLAERFANYHPRLALCRGDDCAVFKSGSPLCVSADMFIENVHFRYSYFEPSEIGHKALAVNVSDLAACGARPVAFTLALAIPPWAGMQWLDAFFTGMANLANRYNLTLAGGDLSRADTLQITINVFGEPHDGETFLYRGGAMPGDALFIVGDIGLARVGLMELETMGRAALDEWPKSCAAHLTPEPKVEAGVMLARAGVNARPPVLMDISDGVVRDLPRLLGASGELGVRAKNIGAEFTLDPRNLHPEVVENARRRGKNPVIEALIGGEDYALLGACAPDMTVALRAAIPGFKVIGKLTNAGRCLYDGVNLSDISGFDHFAI